jgi:succinyl-diaminopimelate desuccinylase
MDNLTQFAEKYLLACQSAQRDQASGGLYGYELEWNLLDADFQPLASGGDPPRSFVDYLREDCLPHELRQFSQLEVFHWMVEWATRPFYAVRRAVYETRLLEAALINALHLAAQGGTHGDASPRFYYWHGNLLSLPQVDHRTIPGSWNLAKRRYLERCVDLYGRSLATAGTHSNLSLPEPLLAWDFMHLPPAERGSRHLDEYKSEFYITAARLLRGFAALFVATGASTPLQVQVRKSQPLVVLTERDSVRNLTFPNPTILDVPDLYRSYEDYLRISYELVRSGARFGNNNWTPVRARSFAEPVERLIQVTSEQLMDLYTRGLYANGAARPADEMARQIEMQNLMARINLPMARVEVRTDDGGQPMEIEIANMTLKHLLMLRFYADPVFGRAFRYDREDLSRARRSEEAAAWHGLRAEIENPFTGKPVGMRAFLQWTLEELRPLAEALNLWNELAPLVDMAAGAPNTAERLRTRLQSELNGSDIVPLELLRRLAEEREQQVLQDAAWVAAQSDDLDAEAGKLAQALSAARQAARLDNQAPARFFPSQETLVPQVAFPDTTSEVLALAQELVHIPSVTACPNERLEEVRQAAVLAYDYLKRSGLEARLYDQDKYPAVLAGFPGQILAPVMLSGHVDVVEPEPDDSQFTPRIEGDYLWGRGAADMKTVVATNLVWLKDRLKQGPPYPPINLLLVGNEENGEAEAMGTPQVLRRLQSEAGYAPQIFLAGERTGERGDELWTEICIQNRGIMRLDIVGRGVRGHSGVASAGGDLSERLVAARSEAALLCSGFLTLKSTDGWQSQVRFPFIQVGTPGVYNITPDYGVIGIEIRPIPQDDVAGLQEALQSYCAAQGLELVVTVMENGITCDPDNPYLLKLVQAQRQCSGAELRLGRKLPATSARFAPGGQGVVWGQSGLAPHGREERHFIPSILPYYQTLHAYADLLLKI